MSSAAAGPDRSSMHKLSFANLFFAGILAGIEIAIHYGVGAPPAMLSDRSQILLRQVLIRKLRVLVPAFFLPAAVSGIALTILDRGAPGFWFRCAALLALLVWIVTRAIVTVPMNQAALNWDAEAPPPNWKALVARTELFHIIGVWAAVVAFALLLAAVSVRIPR
jgi:hypothetical protein